MSRTYKTTDPAALAAMQIHAAEVEVIYAEAKAFRDRFGAKSAVYHNSVSSGFCIQGLVFEPRKDLLLWTAPDRQAIGAQRPRAKCKAGATSEQRDELKVLQADWKAAFPKTVSSWEPVLTALGTDWGALFLSGFGLFEHDGALYVKTGATLAEHCVEILGSEHEAAYVAHKKEKA